MGRNVENQGRNRDLWKIIANNKYVCIYMLREQRFTSRSMVVCREGGVPYWPCGGGRWCGWRGCSCCAALNCWWWREGWWSPPRVCLLGSSLERPPEELRPPEPPPPLPPPAPTPKTPPPPMPPPDRLPGVSSFEPGSTSPLTDPPAIIDMFPVDDIVIDGTIAIGSV